MSKAKSKLNHRKLKKTLAKDVLNEVNSVSVSEAKLGEPTHPGLGDANKVRDMNKNRVGKLVLSMNGDEIPKSKVLSKSTFLIPTSGGNVPKSFMLMNVGPRGVKEINLTFDEVQNIRELYKTL